MKTDNVTRRGVTREPSPKSDRRSERNTRQSGTKNRLLAAALAYVRRGLPVFPVIRKVPLTPHGFKDASIDEDQVGKWWTKWPDAGIGMPTGAASGLIAIDIDPRKGGQIALEEIERKLGALPRTLKSLTGGGGWHLYFKYLRCTIRNSASRLGPGLDVRGDGGYVVLPPSPHESGQAYVWEASSGPEEVKPAKLPAAWVSELRDLGKPTPSTNTAEKKARISQGQRNDTLTSLAGTMRRKAMTPEAIEAALLVENARRCDPPLSESEVRTIAHSVARYPPAPTSPAGDKGGNGRPVGLQMIRALDVVERPVEWLWPARIPGRHITFFSGDPGAGKGHIASDVAARISRGAKWPDGGTAKAGGVIFLSSEDGYEEILRPRLRVAGADLSQIGFLTGKIDPDRPTIELLITLKEDLAAIEATLPRWRKVLGLQIVLLVVDPFLNHLGRVNPGREDEARPLLAEIAAFLQRTGLALIGIRHLNKAQEKSLIYRPGGLMAFTGSARAEYLVGEDPDGEEERRRIFARIKGNLSLEPAALAFKIEGSPKDKEISMLTWLGPTDVRPEDVVGPQGPKKGGQQFRRAKDMLLGLLGEGQALSPLEVFTKAGELGIGKAAVYCAAEKLGIRKRPTGFRGQWAWSLTEDEPS